MMNYLKGSNIKIGRFTQADSVIDAISPMGTNKLHSKTFPDTALSTKG
ncbi:MAG: hypothetical protein KDK90_25260 [Leptospiraceae bacterium]|nr:hypothetical protein [Leptospiraceae bacterium]